LAEVDSLPLLSVACCFGARLKDHREALLRAAEGTADTLALLTWVIFGAVVVGQFIEHFSFSIVLYAVLWSRPSFVDWIVKIA